jgi:conjugal transfer ATP-binding protein TraC
VLFELGRLSNYKDFQKIVQKILIYQIANAMYFQSPDLPKTCLLDESYEFLADDKTGGLGHFINEGYRRAPKYGGNFITITHGMDDYKANKTAKMCYDNAYYKIFLGASQGTLDALKKAGRISPYGEKLIRSLSITKEYSEFMMICGENQTVHRLIVDPFSRILNTTRKTEVVRVEQLTKSGMSLIDAISQVAKEVYGDK